MTWQPISTAPRDGTEFLAYDATTGKMDVCVMEEFRGFWNVERTQSDGEWGAFPGQFMGDRIDDNGERIASAVMVWQPLPSPPVET